MTDNLPAFPQNDLSACGIGPADNINGMTLRDYFAGQALANPALCTGEAKEYHLRRWFGERGGVMPAEIAAKQASGYADAMLAERGKRND